MESLVQQLTQRLSSDINLRAYYLRVSTFKTPAYAFNSYRHSFVSNHAAKKVMFGLILKLDFL